MQQLLLDQSNEDQNKLFDECGAITMQYNLVRAIVADMALRLDASLLRTANITLHMFVAKAAPRPLSASEERYYSQLPSPMTKELERRACIVDKVSKQRRLEIQHKFIDGKRERLALHSSSDMHSVEWGMLQWLYTKEGILGTFTYDRFHTVTHCRNQALTSTGLMFMRLDWAVYLSCRRGPLKEYASHHLLKEAGDELRRTQNCHNIVFRFLAERFARELNFVGGDVGSENWYEDLWILVMHKFQDSGIGTEYKNGRWWSFEQSTRQAQSLCTITLFVLLWIGFKRKWWTSLDTSPLVNTSLVCTEVLDPGHVPDGLPDGGLGDGEGDGEGEGDGGGAAVGGAPDGGAPGDDPMTMGAARERMKTERQKVASTLHYTAKVLCKDITRRCNHGIAQLTMPVEGPFGSEMTEIKTRRSSLELHQRLAATGYSHVLMQVWKTFTSTDFAESTEFKCGRDQTPLDQRHDKAVAAALFKFMVDFMGAMHRVHVQYEGCFPFKFLQLLDPDIAKRARALTFCERSWSCLQKLEANALTCHKLAGFLKDLGFPSMPWVRRIFVGLSEGNFKDPISSWVREDLEDFAQSFMSTLSVENLFNKASALKKNTITGKMTAATLHHRAEESNLLLDYDRRPCPITLAARSAQPAKLTSREYDSPNYEFSLGSAALSRLKNNTTGTSLSAQHFHEMPTAWVAAVELDASWEKIGDGWLARLVTGTLIKSSDTPSSLVLPSGSFGFWT